MLTVLWKPAEINSCIAGYWAEFQSVWSDPQAGIRRPIKRGAQRQVRDPLIFNMAGGRGLEPRQTESESVVLPLDDPPAT